MADEAATATIEIPPDLAARAKMAAWPEDLILELLAAGAQPADLMRYMGMGVTADQVREFMAAQTAGVRRAACPPGRSSTSLDARPDGVGHAREADEERPYDRRDQHRQVRRRARRLGIPDRRCRAAPCRSSASRAWATPSTRSRSSGPTTPARSTKRRSSVAGARRPTSIGRSLQPLPDDLERAICQICTHFSEKAQLEADVLAGWEPELSYGYHEVKLYLADRDLRRRARTPRCSASARSRTAAGWASRARAGASAPSPTRATSPR